MLKAQFPEVLSFLKLLHGDRHLLSAVLTLASLQLSHFLSAIKRMVYQPSQKGVDSQEDRKHRKTETLGTD